MIDLGVALTTPDADFLGYPIAAARRVLLLLLEDWHYAEKHSPDVMVWDNLSHLVCADYNDSKRIDGVMRFAYEMAMTFDSAIIIPAHPKKDSDDRPVDLGVDPERFFEAIMGSSHFVNSTGSLWGLVREEDHSLFLGGRQRGDRHQQHSSIYLAEDGRFRVAEESKVNLPLVLNTDTRRAAWDLLPRRFGYSEGCERVRPAMRSTDTFAKWMRECRRLKVVIEEDGKLCRAPAIA
jgi:hypothetical protein